MDYLWGPKKDLDFWAARKAGLVPPGEARAMQLLSSISDEKRFSFYCLSGHFPALGSMTKRLYMVRRFTTVLELDDGRPSATWCILTRDRGYIPESDHVLALRTLIEGEELAFRKTGNRSGYYWTGNHKAPYDGIKFQNPYFQSLAGSTPSIEERYDFSDTEKVEELMGVMARDAKKKVEIEVLRARRWVTVPPRPKPYDAKRMVVSAYGLTSTNTTIGITSNMGAITSGTTITIA